MPEEDDDRPDNVIPFPSLKDMTDSGGPVSTKPRDWSGCRHQHGVWVDEDKREVTCKRCGVVLDPIQALCVLAQRWDWQNTHAALRAAEREHATLTVEIEQLKKRRVQVRRAGYVAADRVSRQLSQVVKKLREYGKRHGTGTHFHYAATMIDEARVALLDGAGDEH